MKKDVQRNPLFENLLVGVLVFFILWSFFTGLPFFFGGVVSDYINFGLGFQFIPWLVALSCLLASPRSFSAGNLSYAVFFAGTLLLIFIYLLLFRGYQETDFFLFAFNGAILIYLRDDLKLRCFDLFIRIIAFILFISSIEYLIYVLTGNGIILGNYSRNDGIANSQSFDQLLFNFVSDRDLFPRFQSLCEEPGVVGTACGLLIFALKGNNKYKREYFIFLLSGFLTFSLAYYIFLIIHLLTSGFKFRYILLIVVALGVGYYLLKDFLDILIIARVSQDSIEDIDNRTTAQFESAFKLAWQNGQLWFGHGDFSSLGYASDEGGGAGAKIFIWRYGVIGLIMLLGVYTYIFFDKVKKYKSVFISCFLFFIIFWMSFYQRHWVYRLDFLVIFLSVPILYARQFKNYNT